MIDTTPPARELSERLAALVLVLVCALLAVACGSSTTGPGAAAPADGELGSLAAVCHDAETPNVADSDRGVTADQIQVTTIADANSSLIPQLNQELWDASGVFVSWCNALGGINGRRIVMVEGDARLTQYTEAISRACLESFALVGGGGLFDDLGQRDRVTCLLPDFPATVSTPVARGSSLVYQAVPTSNSALNVGILRDVAVRHPDTLGSVAYVSSDTAASQMSTAQLRAAAETVLSWPAPVAEISYELAGDGIWSQEVAQIVDAQARGIVFVGQPDELAGLLSALRSAGSHQVEWIATESNLYDELVISLAGPALDSVAVYVPSPIVPFELADADAPGSEATREYLELAEHYLPDGKTRAALGVRSFAAWLLFATAADACGADLTRSCIDRTARGLGTFDAGGLVAPVDLGLNQPAACYFGLRATSDGFEVLDEGTVDGGFDCDGDNVASLQTFDFVKYGTPVTLGDVGKSLGDLP